MKNNEELNQQFSISEMLLVSSPGLIGGLLCVYENKTSILSIGGSTGLSLTNNQLVVANQFDDGRSIQFIDRTNSKHYTLSKNRMDLHDVLIKDDSLFVVDTENNQVIEFSIERMNIQNTWRLPGKPDSVHINSIAFYQGKLMASIFGRFDKSLGYKLGTETTGQIIDVISGEVFISRLSQPHSLTIVDNLLYMCNSEAKELRIYDGNLLKNNILLPGYTRGIAVGSKNIYVGISQSRNIELGDELSTGSIVVLDRKTLTQLGSINIPFAELYDIQIINDESDLVLKLVSIGDANKKMAKEYSILLAKYQNLEATFEKLEKPLTFLNRIRKYFKKTNK